jgi:hypothetical protein
MRGKAKQGKAKKSNEEEGREIRNKSEQDR